MKNPLGVEMLAPKFPENYAQLRANGLVGMPALGVACRLSSVTSIFLYKGSSYA